MPDEANLLERVRQCDMAALSQVYDDYYDRIYRYVYGYLGRASASEDLTANVFFRLLRSVREGKSPRSNLSAWLYRVAHNLVVDSFRRGPPETLELAEWVESDEPDPAHTAHQHMQLHRVRVALRQLTESQQQVIVLKFFQGMDSREVARILSKSEGAVDALQHRGVRALRKALQDMSGPRTGGGKSVEQGDGSEAAGQGDADDTPSPMVAVAGLQRLLAALRGEEGNTRAHANLVEMFAPRWLRKVGRCQTA